MKKYLTLGILISSICFSLSVASAQVIGDIAPDVASSGCTELSYNLIYKKSKDSNTNGEVSDLQYFLQDQGLLKVEPNGFFGPATLKAVKYFQKKNGFITSGYVGPMTRAKIKEMSCNDGDSGVSISPSAPVACTMEYRSCADGSAMPRDANCKWREDKCNSTSTTPSVSIVEKSVLKLGYDSSSKESSLTSLFYVKVTAGVNPMMISKSASSIYPGFYYFTTNLDRNINYGGESMGVFSNNATDNGNYYLIKAGQSATFNVTKIFKPAKMFADVYSVQLSLYSYAEGSAGSFMNIATTNSVTIVGETSPYISNVTDSNGYITITGARLNLPDNYFQIDGMGNSLMSKFSPTNSYVSIKKSDYVLTSGLSSGFHTISITNSQTGNSNSYGLNVQQDVTTIPTVQLAAYKGYLGGSQTPFISTENISKADALTNCKTNSTNNPTKSIRCIWDWVEIYSYTPVTPTPSTTPICSSEQTLQSDGTCKDITHTCPDGSVIPGLMQCPTAVSTPTTSVSGPGTGTVLSWRKANFTTHNTSSTCSGDKYIGYSSRYALYVGAQLCGSNNTYKLYMSDSENGTYYQIADTGGHGQDHCELVNQSFTIPNDDEITSGTCKNCSLGDMFDVQNEPVYVRSKIGESFKKAQSTYWADLTTKSYSCGVSIQSVTTVAPSSVVTSTVPLDVKWGPQSNTPFNAGTSATAYSFGGGCYSWTTVECGNSNVKTSGGTCVSGSRYSTDYRSVPCTSVVTPTTSISTPSVESHGPNYNAMSCSSPSKSGLSAGSVACYGIWDYGNEFGGDSDMCPTNEYSGQKTGCKVTTKACQSGYAVATRLVNPISMDVNSVDILTFATNLKSSKEAVKQQIPILWEYTCDIGTSAIVTSSTLGQEAIAFGVYEGGPSWPRAEENVYLAIPTSAQGKVLVLTAYEQVNWILRNPNNVAPTKIIAIGYKAQRVTSGDGSSLPQVESNSYTTNRVFQFAYQSNDTYFNDLVKWLATKNIKLTASNFTGSYSAKTNNVFAKPVVALSNGFSSKVLGVATVCVDIPRNLHRGAESSSVTTLQKFLQSKGLISEVTGFYGDKTIEAVKDYQASVGLPTTGMVYEVTRQAIRDETCQ